MTVVTSRTFRSGNSEAVRLPREVAFGADLQVTVVRSGDVLTIYPTRAPLSVMFERLAALPKPNTVEQRDTEPLPERDNL